MLKRCVLNQFVDLCFLLCYGLVSVTNFTSFDLVFALILLILFTRTATTIR